MAPAVQALRTLALGDHAPEEPAPQPGDHDDHGEADAGGGEQHDDRRPVDVVALLGGEALAVAAEVLTLHLRRTKTIRVKTQRDSQKLLYIR